MEETEVAVKAEVSGAGSTGRRSDRNSGETDETRKMLGETRTKFP